MTGDDASLGAVLVVDDEPLVAQSAVSLLAERGYRVEAAGTVADAIECLRQSPIAVMVTDVSLPDGDGWELARRALTLRPNLRFIYTSGVAGSAEMGQSPPGRFLAKPYSFGRLVIAVADAFAE